MPKFTLTIMARKGVNFVVVHDAIVKLRSLEAERRSMS